jgi:hypothetical protein
MKLTFYKIRLTFINNVKKYKNLFLQLRKVFIFIILFNVFIIYSLFIIFNVFIISINNIFIIFIIFIILNIKKYFL